MIWLAARIQRDFGMMARGLSFFGIAILAMLAIEPAHASLRLAEDANALSSLFGLSADMLVAFFTLILAVATFIQGVLIWRAEDSTKQALDIAKQQIEAQKAMLDYSKLEADLNTASQRAYVWMAIITIDWEWTGEKITGCRAIFKVRNTGRTPAFMSVVKLQPELSEGHFRADPNYQSAEDTPYHVPVAPGGEVDGYAMVNMSPEWMTRVYHNDTRLMLFGMLKYRDVLGENRRSGFAFEFQFTDTGDPKVKDCSWTMHNNARYWFYE